jgi:hypothetical protein
MSDVLHYIWLGILAVFQGPALFHLLGFALPAAPFMLFFGLLTGIAVGATPGLAGPMAMAISLPILISVFGFTPDALLPVFGFLIGIMKGATVGGVVPAILFNTPGTPDALMTTLDGHPMARAGQPRRALRIAQISSVAGDTFSDLVLFVCAPFLAILWNACSTCRKRRPCWCCHSPSSRRSWASRSGAAFCPSASACSQPLSPRGRTSTRGSRWACRDLKTAFRWLPQCLAC